jgi:lysophospholipid acyltransferase (LPLAT)-like uncharacterized protein
MSRRFKNRLLDNEVARGSATALAAAYMWLVHRTTRWEVRNGDIPQAYWDKSAPFVLAFWHGRLLMVPFAWDHRHALRVLISRHRDGELITRTVSHFGIGSVRGSSKSGEGAAALREMVKLVRGGGYVGITPDGPRGPRMRASEGVVAAARLTGVPVIPLGVSTARRRLLNSWDRFLLPMPLSHGVFVWGEPIVIDRDADDAACRAARQQIETALNGVTATADRLMGHAPVEPAPLATTAAARP